MKWNWQKSDWPNFSWEPERLVQAERNFLLNGGAVIGAMKHLGDGERESVRVELMTQEAVTTSQIEGEFVGRDSVQSSIRRQLGLATDHRRVSPAEQGVSKMTVDAVLSYAQPLTDEILFAWHVMVTNGRTDLEDVGRYRTHEEPMQVVSGRLDRPTVHFEAPPSARMPEEMRRFIDWFNTTEVSLPALTRSGIAHLYFVSIHPFEDGNGRLARALALKALAQGLRQSSLISLSDAILTQRKSYYEALEAANKSNDAAAWLAWWAEIVIEAQSRTLAQVEFILDKTRFLDKYRGEINARQEKALLRMFQAGPQGFQGGMTASKYMKITAASQATATRDLAELGMMGALVREGELKGTRYHLNISQQKPR